MSDPAPLQLDCPLSAFVHTVSGKWSIPILYRLISTDGPVRFSELQRRARPITQKELTRHLRHLETRGLVTRTVHPVIPPRVEYEATAVARELLTSLEGIATWMRKNASYLAAQDAEAESVEPRSSVPAG